MTEADASGVRRRLDAVFGIDVRALAVFRIALGLLIVFDLTTRAFFLEVFYTDAGVLPRALAPFAPHQSPTSLHTLGGSLGWVGLLHAVGLVAAVCFTLGFSTKLAKAVTWVVLVSLFWRTPGVLNGGDYQVMAELFWCLFLPVGACFSVDAARGARPERVRVLSVASAGLLLQILLLYFFSTFHKVAGVGWIEGTASWYAVKHEVVQRPLGAFLAAFPGEMKIFTWGTLLLEFMGPILMLSPFRTTTIRMVMLAAFLCLQLGLGFSIQLWLFPWISTIALLPFLPTAILDRMIDRPATRLRESRSRRFRRVLGTVLASFALAYVFYSHVERISDWPPPRPLSRLGRFVAMNQGPSMYSKQRAYDVFVDIEGTNADGARIVVDDGGARATFAPVARLRGTYRGKMYLRRVVEWKLPGEMQGLALWICRQWNASGSDDPSLASVELVRTRREIRMDGARPDVDRRVVHVQECGA